MHEVLRVCGTGNSPSVAGDDHSLTVFGSLDFQTCRLADAPKSAGHEAALEVGLETCAAAVRRHDFTHNLSLSLVASCHRCAADETSPLLEALLRRKGRNDLFKAWIAPQGIPPRHQF